MPTKTALPKVEINKTNKNFRVNWDCQEAPESDVLHRRNHDLSVFISGVLVGMGIPEAQVSCATGRTGTVKGLEKEAAKKLAAILEGLLYPLVAGESKRLAIQAKLPKHLQDKYEN